MKTIIRDSMAVALILLTVVFSSAAELSSPPEGFTALFNGRDLQGWWGLGTQHYEKYRDLPPDQLEVRKEVSRADIRQHWRVEDGELVNDGKGLYLTTDKFYGDFELRVDYKTAPQADSGIYLRGCPQVQIWDYTDKKKFRLGADKGSGGLWNNAAGSPGKDPLVLADRPFGEWNSLRILMIGEYVTVHLNGKLVVDKARMHNYFDRKRPLPRTGPIQLQTHGGEIRWRHVFIREIDAGEANNFLRDLHAAEGGYTSIFDGQSLDGWTGAVQQAQVEAGVLTPRRGTLYTEKTYSDFSVMFDVLLPPGGNNGLAIRYPGKGNPAYAGMGELQVLDNTHPKYAQLKPHQYHGSVYGMVPALRGYLRDPGQWNFQKVTVKEAAITVELNGFIILEADLTKVDPATFMAKPEKFAGRHRTEGHFGFAGHGDPVQYRRLVIKELVE